MTFTLQKQLDRCLEIFITTIDWSILDDAILKTLLNEQTKSPNFNLFLILKRKLRHKLRPATFKVWSILVWATHLPASQACYSVWRFPIWIVYLPRDLLLLCSVRVPRGSRKRKIKKVPNYTMLTRRQSKHIRFISRIKTLFDYHKAFVLQLSAYEKWVGVCVFPNFDRDLKFKQLSISYVLFQIIWVKYFLK